MNLIISSCVKKKMCLVSTNVNKLNKTALMPIILHLVGHGGSVTANGMFFSMHKSFEEFN